jgi:hypothetical protein
VLFLWFFPRSVARMLLPGVAAAEPVASSANEWLGVGCNLIGLWVLCLAVPGLIRYLILLYIGYRTPEELSFDGRIYATVIYYIVQLCIGLWLLLGTRSVMGLLAWARQARQN